MNFTCSDGMTESNIKVIGFGEFGKNVVDKLEQNKSLTIPCHVLGNDGQNDAHTNTEIATSLDDYDFIIFIADMEKMTDKMSEFLSLAQIAKEKGAFTLAIGAVPTFAVSDKTYQQFLEVGQHFGGHIPLVDIKESSYNLIQHTYLAVKTLIDTLLLTGFVNLDLPDFKAHFRNGKPSKFASEIASGEHRVEEVLKKLQQSFSLLKLSEITSLCISIASKDVTMDEYHEIGDGVINAVRPEGSDSPDVFVGITERDYDNHDTTNFDFLRVSVYLNE